MNCQFLRLGVREYACANCGRTVCFPFDVVEPIYAACGVQATPIDMGCPHRGDELRREQCLTCAGSVAIKVFACDLYGECQHASNLPGVRACVACPDLPWRIASEAEMG